MLFIIVLQDIPDNTEIRTRLLDAHMQHIGQYLDRIKLGGPLLRNDSDDVGGGLLIVEAASEADAMNMVQADPYFREGLWNDVKIHAFKEIINTWRDVATNQ